MFRGGADFRGRKNDQMLMFDSGDGVLGWRGLGRSRSM